MACSSCGQSVPITSQSGNLVFTNNDTVNTPCSYDFNTITTYFTKLNIVKTNGTYNLVNLTLQQLNSYIGYTMSALNYSRNYCFFAPQLDQIAQIIILINAL